jgi:hypothetical protein
MGAACIQWFATSSDIAPIALTIGGTPLARGTTPPVVTWATNLSRTDVPFIACDTAGTVSTARFRWSLDGGATWQATGQTAAATVTAMTAAAAPIPTFPTGNYSTTNTYSSTVATFPDGAATPHDATNATAAQQPELLYGMFPGVRGVRGAGAQTLITTLSLPAPATTNSYIWCVIRQDAWSSNKNLFGSSVVESTTSVIQFTGSPYLVPGVSGPAGLCPLGLFFLVQFLFTGVNANDYTIVGAAKTTGGIVTTAAMTGGVQLLGRAGGATASAAITLCEWAIFNRAPTSGELASLKSYAQAKYSSQVVNAINVAMSPAINNAQHPQMGRSLKAFASAQIQILSLARPLSYVRVVAQSQLSSFQRSAAKTLTLTQVQTATATKARARAQAATQTQTPSAIKNIGRSFAVAQAQLASVGKALGMNRSATQTQSPTADRTHGRPLEFDAAQSQLASLIKDLGVIREALQTQAASLGSSNYQRLIEALQIQLPHLRRMYFVHLVLENIQDTIVNTFKSRIYSAENQQTPSVRRASQSLGALYADLLALVRPTITTLRAQTLVGLTTDLEARMRPITTALSAFLLRFDRRGR